MATPTSRDDHYAILGVPRNAGPTEIRDAYRALARRHHPDLHPGDDDAEETLKRINAAYAVLSDPDKRRRYDALGAEWEEAQREDEHLRHATGFARAQTDRERDDDWTARLRADIGPSAEWVGLARSAPVVVLILFIVGMIAVLPRPKGSSTAAAPDEQSVRSLREAGPGMNALRTWLHRFRVDFLEEGSLRWTQACSPAPGRDGAVDRLVALGWERRYTEAATETTAAIARADAAGLFTLPLARGDQATLGSLHAIRGQLEHEAGTGHVLDCSDARVRAGFGRLATMLDGIERCLDRLFRSDAEAVHARARAGMGVCGS